MQAFIRAYIGEFTQMAINSPQMYAFYETWVTENFPDNSTEILEMVSDQWMEHQTYSSKVMKNLQSSTSSTLSTLTIDNVG
jgi:hypothetical protein